MKSQNIVVFVIVSIMLIGCQNISKKPIKESQARNIIFENPAIKKITEHQPDILIIKSIDLINKEELKYIKCGELKSDKVYQVAINFKGSSFEPMMYIDYLSGENCYNPEQKLLPNRCAFGEEIYCADFKVTQSDIDLSLQGAKDIKNIKFRSAFCSDVVTADLKKDTPTLIRFNNCNNYINYLTLFQANIEYEYTDPTSGNLKSSSGLISATIE